MISGVAMVVGVIVIGVAGCLYGILSERRAWNKGYCEECATKWRYFDTDSQGGRGYKCTCPERHTTWISWPVDRNYKEEE